MAHILINCQPQSVFVKYQWGARGEGLAPPPRPHSAGGRPVQSSSFPFTVFASVHMKKIKKETYEKLSSIQVRMFQRWEEF